MALVSELSLGLKLTLKALFVEEMSRARASKTLFPFALESLVYTRFTTSIPFIP